MTTRFYFVGTDCAPRTLRLRSRPAKSLNVENDHLQLFHQTTLLSASAWPSSFYNLWYTKTAMVVFSRPHHLLLLKAYSPFFQVLYNPTYRFSAQNAVSAPVPVIPSVSFTDCSGRLSSCIIKNRDEATPSNTFARLLFFLCVAAGSEK